LDPELLARLQFALTASFHFIFPPLSMGLGLMLLFLSGNYLRTKDPKWRRLSFFWVKIYGIVFALGVASGVVMEFEFGMNWSEYSRFVGNVFGSLLAAEGVFAFFLEGGFLGLMLFGGNRLGPRMWFLASLMVVAGAHFSAVWIVAANSWMQTPDGYELLADPPRAVMDDFWAILFTPSFVTRLLHVLFASWTAGAAFVASVGAWYLLKKPEFSDLGRAALSIALPFFIIFAIANAFIFGPESARTVAEYQPTKLAAMEGIWETQDNAPAFAFGWVDEDAGTTTGLAIPGLLTFLSGQDTVTGIDDFAAETRPTIVNLTFQSYHLMVALGMAIVPFALLAAGLWFWKRKLLELRWALWIVVSTVFVSLFVITMGWFTAEFGRQPWIVYELMLTANANSPVVGEGEIMISLGGFVLIYALLLVLFIYLLNAKIQHGPAPLEEVESRPVSELPDTLRGIFAARGRGEERMTK
jgi:cytochrome d ubiquinol oxidase subunit I